MPGNLAPITVAIWVKVRSQPGHWSLRVKCPYGCRLRMHMHGGGNDPDVINGGWRTPHCIRPRLKQNGERWKADQEQVWPAPGQYQLIETRWTRRIR